MAIILALAVRLCRSKILTDRCPFVLSAQHYHRGNHVMRNYIIRLGIGIIISVLTFSVSRPAASIAPQTVLLVVSKADRKLSVVDLATLQVIMRLDVDADPHEVVATPDGRIAYVSNMGNGSAHGISVLDLVEKRVLPSIDTGPLTGPHGLVFLDGRLWFTAQGAKAVAQYNPKLKRIDWIMGTGQDWTHMIEVMPDGHRFYTTNSGSGTVSIFDYLQVAPSPDASGQVPAGRKPSVQWLQTVIPLAKGVEGFDVSPDGRELWTASPITGEIFIIDAATKKITVIPANVMGANRLKFTNDGKRVLVSILTNGDLVVLDANTRKELKRMSLGTGAAGIAMDPNGLRAFVACTADGYVAVIDLKSLETISRLSVGGAPDGMNLAIRPWPSSATPSR
jgi:DNA-binding beta-propeller fold protein YncE